VNVNVYCLDEILGVSERDLSYLDTRLDLLVLTLRNLLRQWGGELDIVARFEERPPVILRGVDL
jgi:hypothetical protein